MAWGSTGTPGRRRAQLDSEWYTRTRKRILRRDGYRCKYGLVQEGPEVSFRYGSCPVRANQVDHIQGHEDRDDNLRSLCEGHHRIRTSWQGGVASQRAYKARQALRYREPEPHPGGATRPRV